MRFWWVSHSKTRKYEVPGGYLWSPQVNKLGHKNHFFDTMAQTRPGDIVFSYSDTCIRAIGVVTAAAVVAPKPDAYASAGTDWSAEGWFVEVVFTELSAPVRPRDHIDLIRPLLPAQYSPLKADGNGNEIYLTELTAPLANALGNLLQKEFQEALRSSWPMVQWSAEEAHEQDLAARPDIGPTERDQLCKARRGQGLFRSRVELLEPYCRVSGVGERRHLRASHIKPWCKSTDQEKLDGNNGLLLAPHVDHLFDQGFISFTDTGELMVSPALAASVMSAWALGAPIKHTPLRPKQAEYMDFHRREIFGKRC